MGHEVAGVFGLVCLHNATRSIISLPLTCCGALLLSAHLFGCLGWSDCFLTLLRERHKVQV